MPFNNDFYCICGKHDMLCSVAIFARYFVVWVLVLYPSTADAVPLPLGKGGFDSCENAILFFFYRCADKIFEYRVRAVGTGFKLGVELHAGKPGVLLYFHNLDQSAVG